MTLGASQEHREFDSTVLHGRRPASARGRMDRIGYWRGWSTVAKWGGFAVLFITYFPILMLVLLSFSRRPLSGVPYPLSSMHYEALVWNTDWVVPLWKSLVVAVAVAVTCMVVATAVGRAIPLMSRQGRWVVIAIIPIFVPGMTMGAALFTLLRAHLELRMGLWSIYLGHLVWALPFSLLLVLVLVTRFDRRLLQAAEDLGANAWQRFWQIEFPILRPGIVGAGLFGFLLSFNEVLRSIFLRGTETTMPVWNWVMAASQQSQVPIIFALATIILAITLPLLSAFFWILFVRFGTDTR
jgi:ABC-type spermidine/putrescine transport system permease subunit II